MIVAVLSDTHLEEPDDRLAAVYELYCRDADVLLHCGDCVGESTWAFLNSHPCFYAVLGNCDSLALSAQIPVLRQIDVGGFRIGMGHGWGPRSRVGDTVASQFSGVDIVCYGHTHIRDWRQLPDGKWLLNPGSLFWSRSGPGGLVRLQLMSGQPPAVEWVAIV